MANICSTYLQIFSKDKIYLGDDKFRFDLIAEKLLNYTRGFSYHTPFYIKHDVDYLEVAFGEKWGPSGHINLFESYLDKIDTIFYRFHDSGGDFDCIGNIDVNGIKNFYNTAESNTRQCKYGFDLLKFQSKSEIIHPKIIKLTDDFYKVDLINGSYYSSSDYCHLLHNTFFSNYKIDDIGFVNLTSERNLVSNESSLLELILDKAILVEYYFKNKLVTYSIKNSEYVKRGFINHYSIEPNDDKWLYFPFDSWFNCVDENYVNYLTQKNIAPYRVYD